MILTENIIKIQKLAKSYNRDITLIAASKMQNSSTIDEFANIAPNFILGENRVQELLEKYNPKYAWHFIGQLQTNKVKYIIDKVDLIHSLDRDNLAKEIEKQARKIDKVQNCLIEVNMGSEVSKGGIEPENVVDFIKSLKSYEHIKVVGIMTVMPNLTDKKQLELLYAKLNNLFKQTKKINQINVDISYLSAGMSNDYEMALKYGSNMIRLGRVLFGDRIYKKTDIAN